MLEEIGVCERVVEKFQKEKVCTIIYSTMAVLIFFFVLKR